MTLRILKAGLDSRIVDRGRPSSRGLGVPIGGAADSWSLALGNALAGNSPDGPALEICMLGPTVEALHDTGVVVAGAPFELLRDHETLRPGKSFTLRAGEILRIGGTPRGARAYLCVPGGFQSPVILGSRSALDPIRDGQHLECRSSMLIGRWLDDETWATIPDGITTLRFLPGAQSDWFDVNAFERSEYTVTPASNRMGLRLDGAPLARPQREMVSEPVCPGTVQVTNDGHCILLGVDGQTIGGYPKIAQVITADLDVMGQLRPGARVRFEPVTFDEADAARRTRRDALRQWRARLKI